MRLLNDRRRFPRGYKVPARPPGPIVHPGPFLCVLFTFTVALAGEYHWLKTQYWPIWCWMAVFDLIVVAGLFRLLLVSRRPIKAKRAALTALRALESELPAGEEKLKVHLWIQELEDELSWPYP